MEIDSPHQEIKEKTPETSLDWTQLPPELVDLISKYLKIHTDFINLRSVCRLWRSSLPKTPKHLPTQLPWLMLPQSEYQSGRAFFDLHNNKVRFLHLPEASNRKRHCGSSHGWLVILDESPNVFLLNPLTRSKLDLPPLSSFPNVIAFNYADIGREYALISSSGNRYTLSLQQMRDSFVKKVVLSSSPMKDTGYVAVAILNRDGDLASFRNADNCWRLIEGARSYSEDVIFYENKFYAVDKHGVIAVCDLSGQGDSPSVSIIETPHQFGGDMQYLVGSGEELLLVTRFLDLDFDLEPDRSTLVYRTIRFDVFKLDRVGLRWDRVEDLGDRVLFIGENSSLSISATEFPGCLPNCIYYTDDYSEMNYGGIFGEHDLGIYKLSDGRIDPLPCYPRNFMYRLRWPPPIWVTPNPL